MAFFDKLTEVAKNVTDRAADGLETNRLTGDIALEKGNIQCYQRELGEFYWAKFALGEKLEEEAMLICDKIVVAQERIKNLEAQIEQIKAEREAEKAERKAEKAAAEAAAKAEAAAQAMETAGLERSEAEEESKPEKPICQWCGVEAAPGQKFCGECGKRIGE